jgi:sugar lactone lactonase YvrE
MLLRSIAGKLALLFMLGVGLPAAVVAQTFVTKWDSQDNQIGKFMGPTGVAVDTVGGTTFLYVCDETGGRILKFNADTGVRVAAFGTVGTGDGQFNRPYGIAIDPASRDLYISERDNGRVQRVTNTGAFVMKWGTPGSAGSPQGNFDQPIGIAADAAGNVYVADNRNQRVQKFRVRFAAGAWIVDNVAMWGTPGTGAGQFNRPYGLALDGAGNVWVADGLNARVQKFSPDGIYLQTVGARGSGDGQFIIPTGIAFDASGAMYVTSTNSDPEHAAAPDIEVQRLQKFSATGAFVWRYGTFGAGDGQFQLPFGIATDAAGFGYVSDYYNIRIQKLDLRERVAMGPRVYFGTMGAGEVALAIAPSGTDGILLARTLGEGLRIKFTVRPDGTLTGTGVGPAGRRTLSGQITGSGVTGAVPELSTTFSAELQSDTGPAATLAGGYTASVLGSAFDDFSWIASANGEVRALATNGAVDEWGRGGLDATGRVTVAFASGQTMTGTIDAAGSVTGMVQRASGNVVLAGIGAAAVRTDRLANVSSRLRVANGEGGGRAAIAGFSIAGTTAKQVLVRAVGPGLRDYGVQDALSNPRVVLRDENGRTVAENDDWGDSATTAEAARRLGAFSLEAGSRDAALLTTLAPGNYSAQLVAEGGAGVGLLEVYDGATTAQLANQRVANLSTRGFVEAGEGVLVAGFVVTGNAPRRVLIRGIGPGLVAYGVPDALVDPVLHVHGAGEIVLAQNDDWATPQPMGATQRPASGAEITVANLAAGAFALGSGSRDAAVVITLAPGNYSATVSGAGGATGAALVEVYELAAP